MHIADLRKGMLEANAIVGASPPIAAGAALTQKTPSTKGVTVSFIGDGVPATSHLEQDYVPSVDKIERAILATLAKKLARTG